MRVFLLVLLLVVAAAAQPPASPALQMLAKTLAKSEDPGVQLNILRGMNAALKGQRNMAAPEGWDAIYARLQKSPSADLRQQAQSLAAIFGGGAALDELRKVLADKAGSPEQRRAALDSLVSAKDAATLPLLLAAVTEPGPLRSAALRALATYDDPAIAAALLAAWPNLASEEKRDAVATLSMRASSARELLAAIDRKALTRGDISAPLARQLQDLKDPAVDAWLAKNWGAVRTSSAEKQKEMARLKGELTPAVMQAGDASHGRALFSQTCAICHTLFGAGAKIGPELPGAFQDIDYLLQNILDPNAIIGKDYQQNVVSLKDGQTLIGIVGGEDAATLTLKSLAGAVTIQKADIKELKVLEVSLMPEGLLTGRSVNDIRDLFAYLGRHGQVPVLADATNANDFFNGTDLNRWNASSAAWKVENGEIIGRGESVLTSDMVVPAGRLTGEIQLAGAGAKAEVVLLSDGEELKTLASTPLSNGPLNLEIGQRAVVSFRVTGAGELRVGKLKLELR